MHNLLDDLRSEKINNSLDKRGFYYVDNFLSKNKFQICSQLALKSWDNNKNDWFLRLSDGNKIYKLAYNKKLITDNFRNKFDLLIGINSNKLTYWYYDIDHSDLGGNVNNINHPLISGQRALLADKCQHVYRSLIKNWKRENFHLTCFDKYSFISKHSDINSNYDEQYKLCLILYLTPNIRESDGGHLVFHTSSNEINIWPKPNRLVLFIPSKKTKHEVRPVKATQNIPRLALSGWLI